LTRAKRNREHIDYFTFVPDGEPTLDINLGKEIDLVSLLDHPTAVLTNGSLLTDQEVQYDLSKADYVSVKVDMTEKSVWRKMNQPYSKLQLDAILHGVKDFSKNYKGILSTETMLVDSLNTGYEDLVRTAEFIAKLNPDISYIAIPIRPTAAKSLKIPDESIVNRAFQIFKQNIRDVEYLIGYEGSDIGYSGDVVNDILSISAVHPLRTESVQELLDKARAGWAVIDELILQKELAEVDYAGNKFYVRRFKNNHKPS
jgi:wyosine [tRNA(Phe)-imidazoG37] synthetase (radical SAM superfamily)